MAFITKAEELTWIKRYKKEKNMTRKKRYQDRIIMENVKFAWQCGMKDFWNKRYLYRQANLNIDDAKSSAVFGMIKALGRFKLSKQVKFNTFAKYFIRDQLQRDLFGELKHSNRKVDLDSCIFSIEPKVILPISLSSLTDTEKNLIYLKFFKSMTYREIGKVIDLTHEAVRKKLRKY